MRTTAMVMTAVLALAASASAVEHASDWPHFLGPDYNQTSPETGLLREWPKDGPEVLWRAPLAQGWNAPSVAGDDVVACWTEPGGQSAKQEGVVCLDAKTGKARWRQVYDCTQYWKASIGWGQGGVRASPCITEKLVFTLGAAGDLFCFDRRTGNPVWRRDLSKEWTMSGEKGWSFSPIVVDGKLIIYVGDGGLRADDPTDKKKSSEDFTGRFAVCLGLDPQTGKDLWVWQVPHVVTSRRGEANTPIAAKFAGRDCVVLYGQTAFVALGASDGKEVWRLDLAKGERATNAAPLIRVGNTFWGPTDQSTYLFEVDGDQPPFTVKQLWRKYGIPSSIVINPVYFDGCLYGMAGGYPPDFPGKPIDRGRQEFVCIDFKTGKVLWREKGFGNSASQILADGLVFARSFQTLHLVEPSPNGYVEKGRFKTHDVAGGYPSMCDFIMPVLSSGRLYVRTGSELLCLKVAAQ